MNNRYVLLSKQQKLPQPPRLYSALTCYRLHSALQGLEGVVALDFETTGLDPFAPNSRIRAISLASKDVCLAIDLYSLGPAELNLLWDWVRAYPNFIMHNATFDMLWAKVHGKGLTLHLCTATLFRHLSTDGWAGQSWSLKTAMTDVLGWEEPNTKELYAWLTAHKLGKHEMSQAPWEVLGPYAALDASATIQLYYYLMEVVQRLPAEVGYNLLDYTRNEVNTEIELLVEQQIEGMSINLEKLDRYGTVLNQQIEELRETFLTFPKVEFAVRELRTKSIEELNKKPIEQFTKTGTVAKRWVVRQNALAEAETAPASEVLNIDSPMQLAWLFYTVLKYKVQRKTEKGEASVDNKTLPYFDEYGEVLIEYRKLRDRLKFVTATKNVQRDGVLHPSFIMSGTVTGRASGGNG